MAHKKKENRNRKRKQPIPPVSIHKTKKRKEKENRKLTARDLEEIGSLIRFKEMLKKQLTLP